MDVTYYVAMSLDGFIADNNGDFGFLDCVEVKDEDYGYHEFFDTVDGLLIGRKSYDLVLELSPWPYDDKPCWVWTHRPLTTSAASPPPGVRATAASPATVVAAAEAGGMRHLWLVGGGELATMFRDAGVVTRYIISVIPCILGHGVPLFADGPAAEPQRPSVGGASLSNLTLVRSQSFDSGLVQLTYET